MMPAPGLDRAAQMIAKNAVAAFEHERDEAGFHPTGRDAAVVALVRRRLAVMPTVSSGALADACNRGLADVVGAMSLAGPRVAAVDVADGSVTMRVGYAEARPLPEASVHAPSTVARHPAGSLVRMPTSPASP